MASDRKAPWLVGLACLLTGSASAADFPSGAQHAYEAGRYGEALKQWETALPKLKGTERIETLLSMATAHRSLGQVAKAFELLNEAHALTEGDQDKARQALALGNLSDGYLLVRQLEEALE